MLPGLVGIVGFNSTAAGGGGGGSSPYGSHTFWRLYIDAGDTGDANTDIVGLQFRTSVGGAQAATGGTAFVGGAGADGPAGFNIPADAFASGTYRRTVDSAWYIGYQFASATSIVEMSITAPSNSGRRVTNARLQYSDDSTTGSDGTWTDAFSIYDPAMAISTATVWPQDLTGASGYKAYRFQWTATSTANRTVIGELEMIKSSVDYTSSGKVVATFVAPATSLCDNNVTTEASSLTSGAGTATMSMASPVLIDSYTVSAGANNARAPRDWTVAGTNDGSTFTTLSTKTGETFTSANQTKTYAI